MINSVELNHFADLPKPLNEMGQLVRGADGVWRPKDMVECLVSFPAEGNSAIFLAEDRSYWFSHRNKVILWAFRNSRCDVNWLMDIGGGNGCVSAYLEGAGINCVLLEPGLFGVQNARVRNVRAVIKATFESAGFRRAILPAVGLFDVLEHIEDDTGFLVKVFEGLKPGGHLLITVPAFGALWSKADEVAGHFRRYSKRSLIEVVRLAGFEVQYVSYFFMPLFFPILLLRTLASLLGRKDDSIESSERDHGSGGGLAVNVLKFLLKVEFQLLKLSIPIPFGSSLILVARKK